MENETLKKDYLVHVGKDGPGCARVFSSGKQQAIAAAVHEAGRNPGVPIRVYELVYACYTPIAGIRHFELTE